MQRYQHLCFLHSESDILYKQLKVFHCMFLWLKLVFTSPSVSIFFSVLTQFTIKFNADCSQNGLDHPPVDISLEDSSGILVDGFERTYDGKLKCRYCNYATRGTARLIEHIRIHTGKFRCSFVENNDCSAWKLVCFIFFSPQNRRETSPLPPVPICICIWAPPRGPHAVTHGWETIQVWALLLPLQWSQ